MKDNIVKIHPEIKCDKTDCEFICTDKNNCAIIPSKDMLGGCFTYTPKQIEIELERNNDINADAEFLEAQKMMLSLIPKNKYPLLFKGLKSKLQYSIDRYVDSNSAKRVESIVEEYKAVQEEMSKRIETLEAICDAAGIKHKITSEDVYDDRKYKGD